MLKFQRIFSALTQQTMKAQTIILKKDFDGFPNEENFQIVEENLPPLKNGEFLAEAEYLTVDPYMRLFKMDVGKPMKGEQVAKIIESKNDKYPVGEYVLGEFGWRTHTIADGTPGELFQFTPKILRDYGSLPRSLALGVLGLPGVTARLGLLNVCKPEKGNVVVVSGATGAVGTAVGQIAKTLGCRTIGITSSDAKGKRLIEEIGFDAYVNYKSKNFEEELQAAAPNNIDCYFDNVGGEVSSSVLNRMNKFGRVAICGASALYNEKNPLAREVQTPVKVNHLTMEGFHSRRWKDSWEDAIQQNKKLIEEGKLKYNESVTYGFENMTRAFLGLFRGENFGKAIVKVKN